MSRLADIVGTVGRLGRLVSLGGRTVLALDTNPVPAEWTHITKVDPEGEKELPLAYPLYLSHTGAVSVGGSRDVNERNTAETFDLVNAAGVPAFHEPSAASHVTESVREKADFMAVPEVLNGDSESLVGTLGKGVEHVREEMAPSLITEKLPIRLGGGLDDRLAAFASAWMLEESVFEAYIIQNLDSAAAREANVTEETLLSAREAKQRAMAAETHLDSEIVYLEYSGTFGGDEAVDLLSAIDDGVSWSRLWYGGGLDSRENAERVLEAGADAVVVGNVFHEIADEEATLYEDAREQFDGQPTRDAVESWVGEQVAVEDSSAARYLSTIRTVPDPEACARRYLAAGVHAGLELRGLADELDGPTTADIREALAEYPPGETAFADAVGDEAATLARDLGTALLAAHFDARPERFAPEHLGLTL
jgi:phosphoglycerol geranylgeranyltransferase